MSGFQTTPIRRGRTSCLTRSPADCSLHSRPATAGGTSHFSFCDLDDDEQRQLNRQSQRLSADISDLLDKLKPLRMRLRKFETSAQADESRVRASLSFVGSDPDKFADNKKRITKVVGRNATINDLSTMQAEFQKGQSVEAISRLIRDVEREKRLSEAAVVKCLEIEAKIQAKRKEICEAVKKSRVKETISQCAKMYKLKKKIKKCAAEQRKLQSQLEGSEPKQKSESEGAIRRLEVRLEAAERYRKGARDTYESICRRQKEEKEREKEANRVKANNDENRRARVRALQKQNERKVVVQTRKVEKKRQRKMRGQEIDKMMIWVGEFTRLVESEKVQRQCEQYGQVESVAVIEYTESFSLDGAYCAIVEFKTHSAASSAIVYMNGREFEGTRLQARWL